MVGGKLNKARVAIPRNFLQQLIAVAAVAAVSVDHIKAGVGIVTHPQLLGRGNLLSLRMQAKGRGEEQAAQQQQRRRQGQAPLSLRDYCMWGVTLAEGAL